MSRTVLFLAALVLPLAAFSLRAQQGPDQKSTKKPLRPFVPPPPAPLQECPKTTLSAQDQADLDVQVDIVLKKGNRVGDLLFDVLGWFESDPKTSAALEELKQLRQFYASFSDEFAKMSNMAGKVDIQRSYEIGLEKGETSVAGLMGKLSKAVDMVKLYSTSMLLLKTKGFSPTGDGWTTSRWTETRTFDTNRGCYTVSGTLK